MNTVTVQELQGLRDQGVEHQLIDVREPYEVEVSNLGGLHIPMADLKSRIDDIRTDVGAAQELGIRGLLVRTGKFSDGDLDGPIEPAATLDSIADLPEWWLANA